MTGDVGDEGDCCGDVLWTGDGVWRIDDDVWCTDMGGKDEGGGIMVGDVLPLCDDALGGVVKTTECAT